jgi:hypothetical protein
MNFEKTSGYITIPDKYVVYTKIRDGEETGEDGIAIGDNR